MTLLGKLGLAEGMVVQELGYDDDVDFEFRDGLEAILGSGLEDEEYDGAADAVLLWWRDGDGDLTDDLMDALTNLVEGGPLLLLTPKAKRGDDVDPADVADAASTTGLRQGGQASAGDEWFLTKLVAAAARR